MVRGKASLEVDTIRVRNDVSAGHRQAEPSVIMMTCIEQAKVSALSEVGGLVRTTDDVLATDLTVGAERHFYVDSRVRIHVQCVRGSLKYS